MEKLNANEIKIGVLSEIRKRITYQYSDEQTIRNRSFTFAKDLRGILFTEQPNHIGSDILYPPIQYPILQDEPIYKETGITQAENLGPLLNYYGITELSPQDLQFFINEYLLNKNWIQECPQLFGFVQKTFGPITLSYSNDNMKEILPRGLGQTIYRVHEQKGFTLTKKEQNQYIPR